MAPFISRKLKGTQLLKLFLIIKQKRLIQIILTLHLFLVLPFYSSIYYTYNKKLNSKFVSVGYWPMSYD